MGENIDIKGVSKAKILAALWNASKQQGMGFIHNRGARGQHMTTEEAQAEIDSRLALSTRKEIYFDYLHGRVMKVNLTGDVLDTGGYDMDNGTHAAAHALIDAGLI